MNPIDLMKEDAKSLASSSKISRRKTLSETHND